MAGRVVVSTLNNDTGVLATQNGMTGIAKAWVQFAVDTGGVVTINGNFNFSSVTRSSQGRFVFTFTTNMPNANYSATSSSSVDPTGGTGTVALVFAATGYSAPTVSSFGVVFIAPTVGSPYDPVLASVTVNSN